MNTLTIGDVVWFQGMSKWYSRSTECIWFCLMNKWQQKMPQLVISAAVSANDPLAMRQQGISASCSGVVWSKPSIGLFLPDDAE